MAHTILILLLTAYPLTAALAFRKIWTGPGRLRSAAVRVALMLGTCLLIFGALEYFFVNHVAVSDGFGFTLSAGNWRSRYGSVPQNSWGLRDQEHSVETLQKSPKLYVIGDSFTAGHGINDHRDRYANILARQLGDTWKMVLIAKGGWGTEKQISEFTRISTLVGTSSDSEPEVVIWQYYINDIEEAGATAGLVRPTIYLSAPRLLRPIVDNYHVANFVYWGVFRRFSSRELAGRYLTYLKQCFADPMCWNLHQRQLQQVVRLVEYGERQNQTTELPPRRVVVVVYPNLMDISTTRKMSDKVAEYFQQYEIPVINMADVLQGKTVEQITVNALDGHANEMVNQLLADELCRRLLIRKSER